MPTRSDIEAAIHAHVGEGRAAMQTAVSTLLAEYTDMEADAKNRVLDDLMSYTEYAAEQT